MALGKLFLDVNTGEKVISNDDDPTTVFEQFTFNTPSKVWIIDHTNNTPIFNIQVVCGDEVALPDEIYAESNSRIRVEFTEEQTGFCNVIFLARGLCAEDPVINPTPTPPPSASVTPSQTGASTPTPTATLAPSVTPTATVMPTPTVTPTISVTPSITPTATVTPTPTVTPTISVTPSITPSITPTASVTPTVTPTPSGVVASSYDITIVGAGFTVENIGYTSTLGALTPDTFDLGPNTSANVTDIVYTLILGSPNQFDIAFEHAGGTAVPTTSVITINAGGVDYELPWQAGDNLFTRYRLFPGDTGFAGLSAYFDAQTGNTVPIELSYSSG